MLQRGEAETHRTKETHEKSPVLNLRLLKYHEEFPKSVWWREKKRYGLPLISLEDIWI